MHEPDDVVIVGAGPAGIGVAAALRRIDVEPTILDRHGVGASFRRWPEGTRLLTPSFTGNQFGEVDLNAVTPDTSPALSLVDEHPTGPAYADYLEMVADLEGLDVTTGVEVVDVRASEEEDVLDVVTADGSTSPARCVVWAAGELQYPRTNGFTGAARCVPTVDVRSWDAHPGGDVVIIGGYESGIDAAVHLVERGRRVTVLDREAPWTTVDPDPSRSLSPYSHGRLREAYATGHLDLVEDVEVVRVDHRDPGFEVHGVDGRCFPSDGPPLLATGFDGSLSVVRDRFEFDDEGRVVVTEEADGSTVLPGLFLAGPSLAHRGAIFCFVYKFRRRFGVVARGVGDRLGVDTSPLEALREHGFLMDDLSCCDDCAC